MTNPAILEALTAKMEEIWNDDLSFEDQAAAVLELVGTNPLVWHQSGGSHIMDGESHTVPTGYTVRYADENGWKWTALGLGAYGWEQSPEAAQAAAQAHADAAHWANTKIGGE